MAFWRMPAKYRAVPNYSGALSNIQKHRAVTMSAMLSLSIMAMVKAIVRELVNFAINAVRVMGVNPLKINEFQANKWQAILSMAFSLTPPPIAP